jgi:peptide/nickel transport system substrate-binding protein
MTGRYSRREALRIGGVAAAGTMLVACGAATEDEAAPAEVSGDEAMEGESEVMMDSGHQSPMLAQRVAAGELPSLDERLPLNPQIVQPWSEIGEYGGMFTVGNPAAGTFHSGRTGVGQEGVMRIGTDLVSVTPNFVESYEINAAGTELTLNLRKGMKWSDGHPHSADDFEFWYVDRVSNEELNARPPGWLAPGGALMDFQKIDDHTVKFIFGSPYPFILKYLSHYNGTGVVTPKHYCQQFHPAYADADTLNSLAVDAGFDDWTGRFADLANLDEGIPEHNPDLPTLGPYKLLEKTQTYWLFERNPYYWKVDPEGNQLPYIDAAFIKLLQDREIQDAAMISGELDIEFGWMPDPSNWPLYKGNEEQGQYTAIAAQNLTGSVMHFQPNQTYDADTVLRDIFRDKRFRIALSLSLNRDEINEIAYFGRATPQQATVIPACSYYDEKYAKLNIEYDVDKANSLLDEMGLTWDAAGEWRLRPDGEKLAWTIEASFEPQKSSIWQLCKGYFQAIGCDVQVKTITGELIAERYPGNLVAMGTWGADKCTDWLFPLTPQFWVPYNLGWESTMYPLWTRFIVTDGEEGEEPPAELVQLWDLWQEMKITIDVARQVEIGKEIVRINAESMYVIGTVALPPHPVITKDNLGNMPTIEQGLLFGWDLYQFYPYHSEQLYLKQPYHDRQVYDA